MKHILYNLSTAYNVKEMKTITKEFAKAMSISVQNVIDYYIPYTVMVSYEVKPNIYNQKTSFLIYLPKQLMYFNPVSYTYFINMVIKDLQETCSTGIYKIQAIKPNPDLYHYTRITSNDETIFKMFHNNIFYMKTYDKKYPNIRSYI